MDFTNKVVILTGASAGIGASCAVYFAKASAKLALVGRNVENLEKTAKLCEEVNRDIPLTIIADVSNDADVRRIVGDTVKRFGRIDVLVNNAGIIGNASLTNGMETFDRIMATNLRGAVYLTELAIPHLIQTKGNVVNISSVMASEQTIGLAAYSMSKAALNIFTKCAAQEFGPKGVRVNAINPGPVKTDFVKSAGLGDSDAFFKMSENICPLKKVTNADDVAELVLFVASDKASCITGSFHTIDCGFSIITKFRD